jgi:hypothetical protein
MGPSPPPHPATPTSPPTCWLLQLDVDAGTSTTPFRTETHRERKATVYRGPLPPPPLPPGLHICLTTPPASATGGHGCRVSIVPTKGRLQRAWIQTCRRESLSNLPPKSYFPSMLVLKLQESNELTYPFLFYT